MVSLAAFVACQVSTLFTEELLTAAKTLVDSYPNDIDHSFVDKLCHGHGFYTVQSRNEAYKTVQN